MFGQHQAKRQRHRAARLKEEQKQFGKEKSEYEKGAPEREKIAAENKKNTIAARTSELEGIRNTGQARGREDTANFLKQEVEGLNPQHKNALQYEANRGIQRNYRSANRKLLGEQSQNGIQGQGGVGYAQQMDLQRMAREEEGQVTRDVNKLDHDMALKKQAMILAGGYGEASQAGLDNQIALDEIDLLEERKKQQALENEFRKDYKQFNRA